MKKKGCSVDLEHPLPSLEAVLCVDCFSDCLGELVSAGSRSSAACVACKDICNICSIKAFCELADCLEVSVASTLESEIVDPVVLI